LEPAGESPGHPGDPILQLWHIVAVIRSAFAPAIFGRGILGTGAPQAATRLAAELESAKTTCL